MITIEQVRGWIDEHWRRELPLRAWWDVLADAGYAFPTWPPHLGGSGASPADARVVSTALSSAGVLGPPSGNGPNMGGPTVLEHGTPEQRQRLIAPMARGRHSWAQLFSEPGAGSDLASLATRAELDGDEYIINGQKVWNSLADQSEWGMLLARTNPDVPKHEGITFMMIRMDQPGVETRPLVQMNGVADFCEVFLTDARVSVDDVIGGPGNGWTVARTTLSHERAAAGTGRARGLATVAAGTKAENLDRPVGELLDETRRQLEDRSTRSEVLLNARTQMALAQSCGAAENQTLRDQLVRYYTDLQVYRWTGQRSRDNATSGRRAGPESSIMKLQLAELAHRSRDLSLSMLGAEGMLAGQDARENGRYLMAAMSSFAASIGGGTNEIQRNIIGERALGLPRELAVDAEVPFRELRRS